MKTDRSSVLRAAAVLLAALLLATGGLADQRFHVGSLTATPPRSSKTPEPRSAKLAKALAQQVEEVQQRFTTNRGALSMVRGGHGEQAYLRQDVAVLVDGTGKDLDQAIARIGEPGLDALRAWSAEELRPAQEELAVARLGRLPVLASAIAAAPKHKAPSHKPPKRKAPQPTAAPQPNAPPQPATITAEKSNRLLDQVGEVLSRIFSLAENDDLEVKLWVGSTPATRIAFRFWPQGEIKGSAPAPRIIRTDGQQDHVLRGLYRYSAAWSKGAVTESIEYPMPAGAPAAQQSERLDLVNGTGFFCCRFSEHYCQQVANEKECRS